MPGGQLCIVHHALCIASKLRSCSHQSLASGVVLILDKVLDEAAGQVAGLLLPLCGIGVGVARVKDASVDALELGGNHEVEERDDLGRSLVDAVVEDGVDDATGVTNRDALAGAVPAGVDQIGLGAALLHALDQLLGILGGVQLEEGLTEACAERRRGLGDAALGAGQLGGEAAQEVVLGLLAVEDRHGRQHAEGVGAEEDHLLGGGAVAVGTLDVLDVIDGIAHAGVLGDTLVGKVNLAGGLVDGDVLEQCVAADGVVDVRLGLGVEVDDLGIAAALEVEHALLGSVLSVVLPVPDRPKKMAVFSPFMSVLALQCMAAMPLSGKK